MTPTSMSPADVAAHEAASYVRRPSDSSAFLVGYGALGRGKLTPLADVPVQAPVTVTARVTSSSVRAGRLRMVFADGEGNELAVAISTSKYLAAYRAAGRPPTSGDRIELRGHVTQQTPSMPKGVAGYAMRVVA